MDKDSHVGKMKRKEGGGATSRPGNKKGVKNKLPFTTFPDAVTYARMLYKAQKDKEMTSNDIAKDLGFKGPKAVRIIGALSRTYDLLEKSGKLWKLSEIGKKVANNDRDALISSFTHDKMFSELFNKFKDRQVTDDAITSSIKTDYKYVDVSEVKNRLKDGINLIKSIGNSTTLPSDNGALSEEDLRSLIKLRYALMPPRPEEINQLENKAIEILSEASDDVLKTLANLMKSNKGNKELTLQFLQQAFSKMGVDKDDASNHEKRGDSQD